MALSIENNSIEELMEVRLILERSSASLAAIRRDEQDLIQMENTLEEMKSFNNINEFIKADIRFHYLIAKAAKNSLLLRLYSTIADSMAKAVNLAANKRITSEQLALSTFEEHKDIYKQIKTQNPKMADKKMSEHLAGSLKELQKITKGK